MNRQILLLGGNQGNVIAACKKAVTLLSDSLGDPILQSAYYESEPWGFEASQNFINQVVEFHSTIEATELLTVTQSIEQQLGRQTKTGTHYESRLIDIDILFIDDLQIDLAQLKVPHPRLHERKFTLLPLMDYWSNFMHPTFKKTITQLTHECLDKGIVQRL
ncbi:2-amino-4-hydroxy-6-hydroxymethyldihydropteridine diphosphokinase [Carboxylicivirga sediminis]|uniref:2-amino-4-hydroxy-6-hydroxymethyldihydropteridine pyrophosphokinase n=1 Tax=Carboxylicivirga sediminis TaxID=2006564 RepID=A0A941F3E7_9BACT|nr:2-amino-4-hydroxy-6-hydroxymethyldihydropteridine diphosphokinase [Carboxylicivirga sediminis]MBR8535060.1 2-amino-4-hydroxy-6-hydroxymethyldihydropteridine diphosphokinase [Carboxylicivirga sediminis]